MNTDHFNLDNVTKHYAICALWASTDDDGTPMDQLSTTLSQAAKERMQNDCRDFLVYLDAEGIDATELWTDEQLGHDFFLTRNSHGAGFWDRGHDMLGDRLTQAAKTFGPTELYLGDDDLIHHA